MDQPRPSPRANRSSSLHHHPASLSGLTSATVGSLLPAYIAMYGRITLDSTPLIGRITPGGSFGSTVSTMPSFGGAAPQSMPVSLTGTQKSLIGTRMSLGSQPTCISESQEGLVAVSSRVGSRVSHRTGVTGASGNSELLERIAHLEAKVNSLEASGGVDAAPPQIRPFLRQPRSLASVAEKAKRLGVLPKAKGARLKTPMMARHRKNSVAPWPKPPRGRSNRVPPAASLLRHH